jgi:hypothetical protein
MGCSKATEQVSLVSIILLLKLIFHLPQPVKKSSRLESGDLGGQCCESQLPIDLRRDEESTISARGQNGKMLRRVLAFNYVVNSNRQFGSRPCMCLSLSSAVNAHSSATLEICPTFI